MDNSLINQRKKIKIISFFSIIIATLIIIISAINILNSSTPFQLINFDDLHSSLSKETVVKLENEILNSLKFVHNLNEEKRIEGIVRPSSYMEIDSDNGSVIQYIFTIDIDQLKSSYTVSFGLIKGEDLQYKPTIKCPPIEEMKYPDNYCAINGTSTLSITIGEYLPYTIYLDDGNTAIVSYGKYDNKKGILNVKVSSCDNNIIEKSKKQVYEWITNLGYNSNLFELNIINSCKE